LAVGFDEAAVVGLAEGLVAGLAEDFALAFAGLELWLVDVVLAVELVDGLLGCDTVAPPELAAAFSLPDAALLALDIPTA
jgi:hypothetical protein